MAELFPVILAGGSGTRLWPLSRKNFPKQFLRLQSEHSLLQQTLKRVINLPYDQTFVISNEAHYFLCQEQLQSFAAPITYLLEPSARNTAPAIACMAHYIRKTISDEAIMLVLPSDHWIGDENSWSTKMIQGTQFAAKNQCIVTFGIQPKSPKTGYGYIESGAEIATGARKVISFHEKPNEQRAKEFIHRKTFLWNSGMFACPVGLWLDELQHHAADIYDVTKQAVLHGQSLNDYFRMQEESFNSCRSESIDYAVMEKTSKAVVFPLDVPWSDLGCWTAVAESNSLDDNGNALHGKVIAKESRDCLISSEDTLVTAIGLQDLIIVATTDAVLVADKRYSQQVKDLVASLKKDHGQLADDHLRVSRPWGYYEVLAEGPTFKVKRLMVKPAARLSLQMHQHRAEHWVVVSGEAEIINGDERMLLKSNQSTFIPAQTRHRLSNSTDNPLYVIEVQSGDYLGEDDITRFDDVYQRKVASCLV